MSAQETFAADWLSLREPADHAARSAALAEKLEHALSDRPTLRIVDLGCGHGNNLRWLAPRLSGRQRWLMVDRDPALLDWLQDRSAARPPAPGLDIETRHTDLADSDLAFLAEHDLVTASALFDLVSEDWLTRLAQACRKHRCGALLALSVTGDWCFLDIRQRSISDPDDRFVRQQFNRHQCSDKGLGAALGPAAARVLPRVFADHRFDVDTRPSDWLLAAGDALTLRLGPPLLQGWRDAAVEQAAQEAKRIEQWHERRSGALVAGELGLRVGHVDLLALPTS
ncbi:class I SAM-dependent methyltransferase [Wenzhouxiangella limi]|uniref:Class I SAM-dependent methyltransferase n=1 Tax=Wenzhouxiangella limi TaxID=2707351 RepID=A0A845UUV2_9GAMM|nr:class I SAM-dependent methyltransferase [Wenzhouxiangella limi]NDY95613.1 class I SAM-dependent methyltransferase [Wenzhouxiangella limi]